ncbi:acetyltransferase [Acidihalobacter yilgarnensis]|uniref:acetyltransferase n=1 Tax=Acidihalobacter yilgarnensis TaxID=2819280 RepID=UPI001E38B920|nr:acetyltransferase [Acidihalobacter yilgarnensis]
MAERVRTACREAAVAAYEEAALRGLCAEGALEYALDAIRRLDLETVIETSVSPESPELPGCEPSSDPVG